MALIRSHGIILHKIPYSESSLILKAFTRESGITGLMARGATRPNSKFHGLLDFFSIYELIYRTRPRQDLLTLSDASLVDDFAGIKHDLDKQSLANVFLEIYLRHIYGPEPSVPLFEILKSSLETLDCYRGKPIWFSLMLCDFLLQFCGLMGFKPQFNRCIHCHSPAVEQAFDWLDLDMGGPACSNCEEKSRNRLKIKGGNLTDWLEQIQISGMRAGTISKSQMISGEELLLAFLHHHSSRQGQIKSYKFYRKMTRV
jgi:DNA repair protein RecO (recombination protein O)